MRSNRELYDDNEKKIAEQDDILDDIIDIAQASKNEANEINDVIDYQNDLLVELDNKMDKNVDHMEKTSEKLGKVIQAQSTCCMYTIIITELMIMILLIFYF